MACLNECCPPHNFVATTDPTGSDCEDSVVPGYETSGGYCRGSKWYNTIDDTWFMGVNDMACNTAQWKRITPVLEPLARVKALLGVMMPVTTATWTTLGFGDESWDETANYDPVAFTFTAPRDGIYRIEFVVESDTTTGWEMGDIIDGRVTVDNINRGGSGKLVFMHSTGTSQVLSEVQLHSFIETKLVIGDVVRAQVYHTNAGSVTFNAAHSVLYINEVIMEGMF